MFQVGPLVEAEGTQPILLRTGHHQTPELFGANPIPYSRIVALPKPSPNPSDPLVTLQNTAFDISYIMQGFALLLISVTMLHNNIFNKVTAYIGKPSDILIAR